VPDTRIMSFLATLIVGLILPAAVAAHEIPTVVEQKIRVDGRTLGYEAETGRVPIRDVESGEPHGYMFYIAYRVASNKPRPVVFLWNGGPGSNSTLLHFEAFGPRRLENGRLIDNAETLLSDADLVFVDPIGTGFSRPAKAEYADEFYNTLGDIASVTEFVRAWLLLHDATGLPIFLIGESWGAGRAGSGHRHGRRAGISAGAEDPDLCSCGASPRQVTDRCGRQRRRRIRGRRRLGATLVRSRARGTRFPERRRKRRHRRNACTVYGSSG
jgi:pimeloyl-ACP methyl ester carboxylesterase